MEDKIIVNKVITMDFSLGSLGTGLYHIIQMCKIFKIILGFRGHLLYTLETGGDSQMQYSEWAYSYRRQRFPVGLGRGAWVAETVAN